MAKLAREAAAKAAADLFQTTPYQAPAVPIPDVDTGPVWTSDLTVPGPTEDDTIGLADAALNRPIVSSGPGDEAGGEKQRGWKCPEVVGYLKDGKYPERMTREGTAVPVMVHMTVNARGVVTDAWIEEDDESVFPSIDIAARAVARDCRFDARLGAADTTYRVPITFDPRRR
ncbi:MAG: energy transducer TonB [Spirochaetaceae bacterium]|nr:energy transducer TonB [Spirochaetaceae bacterium]MDE0222633.1 energy transducer TonB [Spirochaetaceae bacterium]